MKKARRCRAFLFSAPAGQARLYEMHLVESPLLVEGGAPTGAGIRWNAWAARPARG